jgi:Protein of unknown function (DUF3086)
MNPDGTANRKSDLRAPTDSPEIIDVSVVAEISSGAVPPSDIWDSGEVVPPQTANSAVAAQLPEIVVAVVSENSDPAIIPSTPASTEDNWETLLDEISQELAPELIVSAAKVELLQIDKVDLNSINPIDPKNESFQQTAAEITAEIDKLKVIQSQLEQQIVDTQISFGQMVQTSVADLEQRRQKLQLSVEQLERRRDRIKEEINKSFAGASQDIAIRLQGFKDYLVGSLQDLVIIADEIEFPQPPPAQIRLQTPIASPPAATSAPSRTKPQFAEPAFKSTAGKVRSSIDRYRTAPDYYAPTWQLRRTFEAVHAEKISDWFFTQDGRGAIRTMGSRLQNILVAAAAVSALRELYGDYLRTLVLANLPERLGDWRRGFQDCLGLSKSDFGGNGGIILFEDPEALIQKVDRIVANKEMPLIIIDNSEGKIDLSILQYPLWLAFAPDQNQQLDDYREYR